MPITRNRKSYHGLPCPYCRQQMNLRDFHLNPTWDHVVPKSRGGREKIVCCHKCNGIKGDMMPERWASYMAANPGWWLLTRQERRARNRAVREKVRIEKWGARKVQQGSPPAAPVIVPPEYIWPPRPPVIPRADSEYILTHGKKAFRAMERRRAITPELIASTIELDARLRRPGE